MPRRLLRDGRVVEDDWQYLTDIEGATIETGTAAGSAGAPPAGRTPDVTSGIAALIIPFDRWSAERETWSVHPGRLGVLLLPAHQVEALAADLARVQLVAAEFPGPSDGRGYTQARLLRERYDFTGELRATGYVRRDQLFLLARCGFNSFQLAENDLDGADSAFSTFSAEYQPSNDAGIAHELIHR